MTHDLGKARELAEQLGYVPQMGVDILVSDHTPPERLAQLRANGFNPLFEGRVEAKIVIDPKTGLHEYHDAGRGGVQPDTAVDRWLDLDQLSCTVCRSPASCA
jgi:hypothetical protein